MVVNPLRRSSQMGFEEQCPSSPSPSPSNKRRGIEKAVSKVVRDLRARRESLATHTGLSINLVQFASSSPLAWIPLYSSPAPRVSPNFFLRRSKPKPSAPYSYQPPTRMAKMPPSSPSFTPSPINPGRNPEKKDKNSHKAGAKIDEMQCRVKTREKIILRVFSNWIMLSMMAMGCLCIRNGAALGITLAAFLIFRLIYLLTPGAKPSISSRLLPAVMPEFLSPKTESLHRSNQPGPQKPQEKKSSLRASIRSLTIQVPKRALAKPDKPLIKTASLPSWLVFVGKPHRSFHPAAGENQVINEKITNTSRGRRKRSTNEPFPAVILIVLGMGGLFHGHMMAIAMASSWLLFLSMLMPYLKKSCYGHINSSKSISTRNQISWPLQ